jgi:hypothetical protein
MEGKNGRIRFWRIYAKANIGHPSRTSDCCWKIKSARALRYFDSSLHIAILRRFVKSRIRHPI